MVDDGWSSFFEKHSLRGPFKNMKLSISLEEILESLESGGQSKLMETLEEAGIANLVLHHKLAIAISKEIWQRRHQ